MPLIIRVRGSFIIIARFRAFRAFLAHLRKGDERVECEQELVLIIQIQFYSNFKSSIIHGFIDLFIYALLQNRDAVVVVY